MEQNMGAQERIIFEEDKAMRYTMQEKQAVGIV
jgi:hypothetical protein